jgi:hypothetical protein
MHPQYLLVCRAILAGARLCFQATTVAGLRRGALAGARDRLGRHDWGKRQRLAFEQLPYLRADVPEDRSDCEGTSCRDYERCADCERNPDQGRHTGGRIGKAARFLKRFCIERRRSFSAAQDCDQIADSSTGMRNVR